MDPLDNTRVDRRVAMLASHVVPGGASPDPQVSLHRTAAAPPKQGFKVAVLGAAGGRATGPGPYFDIGRSGGALLSLMPRSPPRCCRRRRRLLLPLALVRIILVLFLVASGIRCSSHLSRRLVFFQSTHVAWSLNLA